MVIRNNDKTECVVEISRAVSPSQEAGVLGIYCLFKCAVNNLTSLQAKRIPLYLKRSSYRAVNTFHLGYKNNQFML